MSTKKTLIIVEETKYREYSLTIKKEGNQFITSFQGNQKIEAISSDSIITAIRCAKDCIDLLSWKYFTTFEEYKISARYNVADRGFEFQALKREKPTLSGKNFSFYSSAISAAIKFIETEKLRA